METSRERIVKAIDHIQPEITPLYIPGTDGNDRWLRMFMAIDTWDLLDKLGSDVQTPCAAVYSGPNTARGLDIWGSDRDVTGHVGRVGYSAQRGDFPLAEAETIGDIECFNWPSPDHFDYEVVAKVLRAAPADKAHRVAPHYAVQKDGSTREELARQGGPWLPILCSLFNLLGFERTLMMLHTDPILIEAAIAKLATFVIEFSRRLLDATRGLTGIYYWGDDFATQTGLLLSPEQWRRFLKPAYKRVFELAKSYDLKIWFHCCGTFGPVLPDLIEMGMDVWEPVQACFPGNEPVVLKREYGQHIVFAGAISTQRTLAFGTPPEVRAEVRERIRVLGRGGGYICGPDHVLLSEFPIGNVLAMVEETKSVIL